MGSGSNSNFTRQVETPLEGDVLTGPFEFELNALAPRNNLVDYFYFVDAEGAPVAATAGTVTVTLSPLLPLYQNIADGTFDATTATDGNWLKPNGFGKAVSVRITLSGIAGPPVGFRAHITQSVS